MIHFSRAGVSVKIQNVVASVTLKHTIDLNSILKAFPNIEYYPEVFPGLCFRLDKPKTANLIFSTGKMVCTGAKSEREAKRAVKKVIRTLRDHGIVIVGRPTIKIQNVVASISLGPRTRIDIENMVYRLEKTMYEPEQFPGAVYRMDSPKVVILAFSTGKLVCTGAKRESDVYEAVDKFQRRLEEEGLITYEEEEVERMR